MVQMIIYHSRKSEESALSSDWGYGEKRLPSGRDFHRQGSPGGGTEENHASVKYLVCWRKPTIQRIRIPGYSE